MNEKRLHNVWRCMVGRCHNPNWNNYFTKTYYKDKGIVVCDAWRESFEHFKEWALENGYEDGLSIDRIDADGNYEPSNCRWITYEENRRLGLERGRGRNKTSKYPKRFMVVERTGKIVNILRDRYEVLEVIQTDLYKSEADAVAKQLNDETWKDKYMSKRNVDHNGNHTYQVGDKLYW